jgi:hypothetical protein
MATNWSRKKPKEKIPLRAVNAFVPIITLVVALMVSLFVLGEGDTLVSILETTSPYQAMMYSSFVGVLVAATTHPVGPRNS